LLTASTIHRFTLTTSLTTTATDLSFTVTNCYGPCDHSDKQDFLAELLQVRLSVSGAWLLLGDFNLTCCPEDRSNGNFNIVEVGLFNDTIECCNNFRCLTNTSLGPTTRTHPSSSSSIVVVWTSLGPLPRWVPGPTTRWAPGTTRLALHGT
jgi:hypothetical protein